jgi:hypothetical protein
MPSIYSKAIHDLTVKRYTKDLIKLGDILQYKFGLQPGTVEYENRYRTEYSAIDKLLAQDPEGILGSALFVETESGPVVLCALRIVRGQGDAPINQTIGDPSSSLPTHQLLSGFGYNRLNGFDPAQVVESQVCECTRLVKADKEEIMTLLSAGVLNEQELNYIVMYAFSGIFYDLHRLVQSLTPSLAGYLFNTHPKGARIFSQYCQLNLEPLPSMEGICPTPYAVADSYVLGSYFKRQVPEFRQLFTNEPRDWSMKEADINSSSVCLPFIVLNDDRLEPIVMGYEHQTAQLDFINRTTMAVA